jgi:hypothetical protein
MRLSMIRAAAVCTASVLALAACAGHGIVPPSQSALAPSNAIDSTMQDDGLSPLVTTCSTSPPQYQWILKGACTKITLKPTGGSFALGKYQNITVKGSIGANSLKGPATVYLVDATDKGDIANWKGGAFPKYKAKGTTFVYAAAVNQGKIPIVPKTSNKPIFEYDITDAKGLPGTECAEAVLTIVHNKPVWKPLPGVFKVQGKVVTLRQYNAPRGIELPSKIPLYFAVNCF